MPVQAYGFQPSPAPAGTLDRLKDNQRYYEEHLTLVAEVAGVDVADASAVPMQQNVRGGVYRMAGVAGVATLPQARRRGYASALVTEILGLMRDQGHVVSALYPFRPSFYERFGFARPAEDAGRHVPAVECGRVTAHGSGRKGRLGPGKGSVRQLPRLHHPAAGPMAWIRVAAGIADGRVP